MVQYASSFAGEDVPWTWWSMTCKHCGNAYRTPTRHEGYCSDSCRKEARRKRARLQRAKEVLWGDFSEKKCDWCQTPYTPRRANQRFCKPSCKQRHYELSHSDEHPTPVKICKVCESAFFPRSNAQQYCSPECRAQERKIRRRAHSVTR